MTNEVLSLLDSSGPAGSTGTNPRGRVLRWRGLAEHGTCISGEVLKARVVAVGVLGKTVSVCIQESSTAIRHRSRQNLYGNLPGILVFSVHTGTPAGPGYSVEAPGPAFPVKFTSWALTKPAPRTTAVSKVFILKYELKLRVLLEMKLIQKKRRDQDGKQRTYRNGMRGELGEIKVGTKLMIVIFVTLRMKCG